MPIANWRQGRKVQAGPRVHVSEHGRRRVSSRRRRSHISESSERHCKVCAFSARVIERKRKERKSNIRITTIAP
ncbi:hypothetical protein Naga_100013g1 [Nannochloropsis gaditana]|uniref:Uncharacterized protein n=1 Tax=Nannochloropsis gaditana TaxID=72520 RepID=W7U400_9STRA|nr:hypothetical protein Naga_100013g1 [Nannochloropsis gaditana]